MKIARVQNQHGETLYASPLGDGWQRLEGSLEEGWRLTGQSVEPVKFLPPVSPPVIFVIGINYRKHADEMGHEYPEFPVVTMKNPAAATGHGEPVLLPRFLHSDSVDYEVELAVVIGKNCKNIHREEALEYVAGYTVANDVSARDWQNKYSSGQWVKGKSFDTFCPLGPVMATPDEIPDPDHLNLRMEVNGEVRQSSNTSDMIFDVRTLITFLSGSTTLLPGTVILTGTPPGVGAGRTPPRFLKAGDRMRATLENIGSLENPVAAENP